MNDGTTLGAYLKELIEAHTNEKSVVDLRGVIDNIGFNAFLMPLPIAEKGSLYPKGSPLCRPRTSDPTILLNEQNTEAENRTVMALLIAEFILVKRDQPNRILTCDVFFLRNIRQYRISRQLFLATRLVIPEKIIEFASDLRFNMAAYCNEAKLLPSFVGCACSKKDVGGLLGIIDSIDMSFTVGRKIGNSKNKASTYLPNLHNIRTTNITDLDHLSPGDEPTLFEQEGVA